MKHKISKALLLIIPFAFTLSCKKLTEIVPKKDPVVISDPNNPNAEVNSWIYDEMKTYYLWEDQLAAKNKTDNKLKADDYFESILVKPGDLDRFSWIEPDADALKASLKGVNTVVGVRFTPFNANAAKTKSALSLSYVLKNSPAEKAGLKRGDFITQVDGVDLTPDNYSKAFANPTMTVTLGELVGKEIVSTNKKVSITKAEVVTDAIQHYSIIDLGTKKVGYLVYLQFISSSDADLRRIFGEFKQKGVNELVLDFRFNGGGLITTSDLLSSLVVKDLKPGTLMNKKEYNKLVSSEIIKQNGASALDTKWLNEPNNLGSLQRVFVITTKSTASASELVINNLKPFMEVVLIGDNTYGKSVGSFTIEDTKKRWKWGMQPIVLRTVNAAGKADYGTKDGFKVDIAAKDDLLPYLPFGDVEETMLNIALEKIKGGPVVAANRSLRKYSPQKLAMQSKVSILENPKLEVNDMYITKLPFEK